MIEIRELEVQGNVGASYNTSMVDVSSFHFIRLTAFCNDAHTSRLYWSIDGINSDLYEAIAGGAGSGVTGVFSVKARYLYINYTTAAGNNWRTQCLFGDASSGLAALENVGSGAELYINSEHKVRTVTSSDGSITITQNALEIDVINATPPVTTTLASAGGTESLVTDGVGPSLEIKGLTAGSNITLTPGAGDVSISTPTVTLTSAGGTQSLVTDGSGPTLAVKGLTAGTGVSLTPGANDVTIANTSPASSVTLTSAGGTESLVTDGVGPSLSVKGLTAGSGITLTPGANDVTITSSGGTTVSALNTDVQVAGGPAYTVGIATGGDATSSYIIGQNLTGKLIGTEANNVILGKDSGNFTYNTATANTDNVLVGYNAGRETNASGGSAGQRCVCIGTQAGGMIHNTGVNSVCIGYQAGRNSANITPGIGTDGSVCIGYLAGAVCPGNGVIIGDRACSLSNQSNYRYAVAIGHQACENGIGLESVHIGYRSGQLTTSATGSRSVGIGKQTHRSGVGTEAVAIGMMAGETDQGAFSVAIGSQAGNTAQAPYSVCIGYLCAPTATNGRFCLGGFMEAVQGTASVGTATLPAKPQAFMRIEYNGTLYKIPLYND